MTPYSVSVIILPEQQIMIILFLRKLFLNQSLWDVVPDMTGEIN